MGVALSPDPTDRTIRIWDAETGASVGDPLNGHTDRGVVRCLLS
jgi:WD40 repeat protein